MLICYFYFRSKKAIQLKANLWEHNLTLMFVMKNSLYKQMQK